MYSATKGLSGHSDLVLGAAAVRDADWAERLRAHRLQGGAIAGPFEAWLLQRSLPPLALRVARPERERACAGALPVRARRRRRRAPSGSRHGRAPDAVRRPARGLTLETAACAQRFLGAVELVVEATSFGGVHSTAERRARWATDAVTEGFIRFSAGCEDADDLPADVEQALARS